LVITQDFGLLLLDLSKKLESMLRDLFDLLLNVRLVMLYVFQLILTIDSNRVVALEGLVYCFYDATVVLL
jgi:hypothetical protein